MQIKQIFCLHVTSQFASLWILDFFVAAVVFNTEFGSNFSFHLLILPGVNMFTWYSFELSFLNLLGVWVLTLDFFLSLLGLLKIDFGVLWTIDDL